MGRPRKIISPEEASQESKPDSQEENLEASQEQKATETPKESSSFSKKFIKNINPGEKIILADKTEVSLPKGQTFWIVTDKDLAEKLESVAEKYSIILA